MTDSTEPHDPHDRVVGTDVPERYASAQNADPGDRVVGTDEPERYASAHNAKTGWSAWAWLAPVLAPILVFADALVGRRVLAPGDGHTYYLPMHVVAARMWKRGVLPSWDTWSFAGSPLLAVHQSAVYYPPNWAHVLLPVVVAHNVTIVTSFVVAGVGAYLLARRITDDPVAAAVAGVTFGLSGFLFGHVGHASIIASVGWLPWVLWGFELLRERITPLRLLAGGGTLAMSIYAGHSQMFAFTVVILGLYAGTIALAEVRTTRGRPLLAAAALVGTGVGLGAAQLLPVLAILGDTDRSTLDFTTATSFSYSVSHSVLLLFPYLFGNAPGATGVFDTLYRGEWNLTELAGYVGAGAFALAIGGIAAAVRRDARVAALLVVAAVSGVMALGDATRLSLWIYELPVFGQFRSWGRYAVGLDLVVAVLAAYGVAALRRADRHRRALIGTAAAAGFVVAIAVLTPVLPETEDLRVRGTEGRMALALPVAAAVLVTGGAVAARRRPQLAGVAIVAVVGLDMVLSFGIHYEWRTSASPRPADTRALLDPDEPANFAPIPDAPGGIDRVVYGSPDPLPPIPWYPRATGAKELRSVNGFDPLAPAGYLEAVGEMDYRGAIQRPDELWRPEGDVLDLLRVSLVVTHPPNDPYAEEAEALLGTATPVAGTNMVRFERTPALDDAFLVGAARTVDRDQALRAIAGYQPFDPAQVALVEDDLGLDRPGPAGDVVSRHWGDTSARFEVDADRPAVLVVSQAWFPGWHATVDGDGARVLRVDGLVQGVAVPAGRHTVELRYRAPGAAAGLAVSFATLIALGGWAGWNRRKGAQRSKPT